MSSDKISGMPGGSYLGRACCTLSSLSLNANQPKVTRWGIWLDWSVYKFLTFHHNTLINSSHVIECLHNLLQFFWHLLSPATHATHNCWNFLWVRPVRLLFWRKVRATISSLGILLQHQHHRPDLLHGARERCKYLKFLIFEKPSLTLFQAPGLLCTNISSEVIN